jgi:hypothetical protein
MIGAGWLDGYGPALAGWLDGYAAALAVVFPIAWARAAWSRLRHRRNPDAVEGHRVDWK